MVIKDNANIKTGEVDDTVKVTEDNLVFSVATDAHQCYLLILRRESVTFPLRMRLKTIYFHCRNIYMCVCIHKSYAHNISIDLYTLSETYTLHVKKSQTSYSALKFFNLVLSSPVQQKDSTLYRWQTLVYKINITSSVITNHYSVILLSFLKCGKELRL